MTTKTTNIINWSLAGLVGFIFIGSAISKLIGGNEAIEMASGIGLTPDNFKLIAILELVCVLLFIIPRTGVLGTLLLAAYMGGAIATHLTHGQPIVGPAVIEAIVWVVAVVRFPELRNRLLNSN
ncbi:MAG: DoxX family protein [Bacteroidetes bacterium]|nr:MAG: DoxX family protein [Bacteroidota bacterium]